jgi:hypothetical protein
MCGAILPLPQYVFMASCTVKAQRKLPLTYLKGAKGINKEEVMT